MRIRKFIASLVILTMIVGFFSNSIWASQLMFETQAEVETESSARNRETDIAVEDTAENDRLDDIEDTLRIEKNENDTVIIENETEQIQETDSVEIDAREDDMSSVESRFINDGAIETFESDTEENFIYADTEDAYVYNGEEFLLSDKTKAPVSAVRRLLKATVQRGVIDYTYWAIHKGSGLGDVLEDGRELDHLGCIMLQAANTWKTAYCIHHNANLLAGHEYADIESYLTNSEKRELTGRVLHYGFQFANWNPGMNIVPADEDKGKYTATQMMIWFIEKGWYQYDDASGNFVLTPKAVSIARKVCDASDQYPAGSAYVYFNNIYTKMQNHSKMPSFSSRNKNDTTVYTMGYDFETQKYTLTLTDTNAMLGQCAISGITNTMEIKKDENQLTIVSAMPINQALTLTLQKQSFDGTKAVTIWSDQDETDYQQIGTYTEPGISAVESYIQVIAPSKKLKIEKLWNNHNAAVRPDTLTFNLYRGYLRDDKAFFMHSIELSESDGWKDLVEDLPQYDVNLKELFYTFEEVVPDNYESRVEQLEDMDGIWMHRFINTLKTGQLQILKKSLNPELTEQNKNYSLAGAVYSVYSDEKCTDLVGTLVTDETGQSNSLTDIAAGTYYIRETHAPLGYKKDIETYKVEVTAGEQKILEVFDAPYECEIKVVKSTSDGKPMMGVSFALCDEEGKVIDEKVSNEKGEIEFGGLQAGNYQLMETATLEHYQLLQEAIQVALPCTMTEKEIKLHGIREDQYSYDREANVYTVYSLTYYVTNASNFTLPMTGGGDGLLDYLPIILSILCVSAGIVILYRKKYSIKFSR